MPLFVSASKKMQKIDQLVDKASKTDTTVLITGEKGLGKSIYARRIHDSGLRKNASFVLFDAGKNDASLGESITKSHNGTLYINEVSYLQSERQQKLEQTLTQIAAHEKFRLIVSTSVPLEKLVKNGTFPEPLYYRLCVMRIKIPPLRERREDIPPLIDYLTEIISGEYNRACRFDEDSKTMLAAMPWKGNISELKRYIRSVINSSGADIFTIKELEKVKENANKTITGDSLSDKLQNIARELLETAKQSSTYIALEQYKKLVIPPVLRAALNITGGNKSLSAKLLGINRNTLKKIIREYNIED